MKSKIYFFYYQSLDTLKKMANIINLLDRKYLYKLIFIFISMFFGAFFELIFLASLSAFIKIVLNNGFLIIQIIFLMKGLIISILIY